jgi:hypothetical protein
MGYVGAHPAAADVRAGQRSGVGIPIIDASGIGGSDDFREYVALRGRERVREAQARALAAIQSVAAMVGDPVSYDRAEARMAQLGHDSDAVVVGGDETTLALALLARGRREEAIARVGAIQDGYRRSQALVALAERLAGKAEPQSLIDEPWN